MCTNRLSRRLFQIHRTHSRGAYTRWDIVLYRGMFETITSCQALPCSIRICFNNGPNGSKFDSSNIKISTQKKIELGPWGKLIVATCNMTIK